MLDVQRRALLATVGAGISSVMLPGAAAATSITSGPPEGTTSVAWTDGDLFDAWTSRSGVTTSDLSPTNAICWQVLQAHRAITIASGTASAYGINTYLSGDNTWTWWGAVSTVANTLGSFGAPFTLTSSNSYIYAPGGFSTATATATLSVPAGHYFMLGVRGGPYYRSFRTIDGPRTAAADGIPVLSAIDRVYYGPHSSSSQAAVIPSQVGGTGTFFTEVSGHTAVLSIRPSLV